MAGTQPSVGPAPVVDLNCDERLEHMPRVRRRLNEIEYFNWCVEQPYNIAVSVRLRGSIEPKALRSALGKAQQRHPMLTVNTLVDDAGVPWLDSAGVGAVPLEVLRRTDDGMGVRVVGRELTKPFSMDVAQSQRLPLLRVTLLVPPEPDGTVDLVLCAQHLVADGLSMLFLTRDLLTFLRHPDDGVEPLTQPASAAEILPAAARRRVAKSARRLRIALWLLRAYRRITSVPVLSAAGSRTAVPVHSWNLTQSQTSALLAQCKAEGVSVQSAVCTAFLPTYTAINSPVDLRGRLARDVGESVGLFVGGAIVRATYDDRHDFWTNARAYHRKLRRALRDPFFVFRVCSTAVPPAQVREFGTLMMALVGRRRPLGVTNLRVLDEAGLAGDGLGVESFYGGASGFATAALLTVYTIGGAMRFHLRGTATMTVEQTAGEVRHAMDLLLSAIIT